MERLTKENWLPDNKDKKCFYLQYGFSLDDPDTGKMISSYDAPFVLTDVDYNGYMTLASAKQWAEWILQEDPAYPFTIIGVGMLFADEDELTEYLDEYGNDDVVIEEFNKPCSCS